MKPQRKNAESFYDSRSRPARTCVRSVSVHFTITLRIINRRRVERASLSSYIRGNTLVNAPRHCLMCVSVEFRWPFVIPGPSKDAANDQCGSIVVSQDYPDPAALRAFVFLGRGFRARGRVANCDARRRVVTSMPLSGI